jgi:hypothetical protein
MVMEGRYLASWQGFFGEFEEFLFVKRGGVTPE